MQKLNRSAAIEYNRMSFGTVRTSVARAPLFHFLQEARIRRCMSSVREREWTVYLSGEIHSDWRDVIDKGVNDHNLPVRLTFPNTSHEDSDDCGKRW